MKEMWKVNSFTATIIRSYYVSGIYLIFEIYEIIFMVLQNH